MFNRFFARLAACALTAGTVLAGCSGNAGQSGVSPLPGTPASVQRLAGGSADSRLTAPDHVATMYVTNRGTNQILGFPATSNGDVPPTVVIGGSNTQLGSPVALAIAKSGTIYAAQDSGTNVLIFPKGSKGNVTPTILGGSNLPLVATEGIGLDASSQIYVSDFRANQVFVFAAGATGNAVPIHTISGSNTLLNGATGMAFDSHGNLYVANYYDATNSVVIFAPGADGNATPSATLGGSNTGLYGAFNLAIDKKDRIYVPDEANASVEVFAAGATGNVAPIRTIAGGETMITDPTSIGLDAKGNVYVTNYDPSSTTYEVLVFGPTQHGNVAPLRTIGGATTTLNDPFYPSFH